MQFQQMHDTIWEVVAFICDTIGELSGLQIEEHMEEL